MKGLDCFRTAGCTVLYNSWAYLLFIKIPLKMIRFWADRICKNEEEISLFMVFATFFLLSLYAEALKRIKYVKRQYFEGQALYFIESFSVYFVNVQGTEKLHNTVYPRDQHLLRMHPGIFYHYPSSVLWDTFQSFSCFIFLVLYCSFLF